MKKQYLEAGKIVSVHGLKGEVKVMPYMDVPELLCEFDRLFMGKNRDEVGVERARVFKNMVIMKLEGTDTPENAEKLRNKLLYIHRDDLELDEDTYFIQDLIGMTVKNAETGFEYGEIADVMQTGANDVYVVKGADREYLVPAIPDVVKSTDVENDVMTIIPLEGLFD